MLRRQAGLIASRYNTRRSSSSSWLPSSFFCTDTDHEEAAPPYLNNQHEEEHQQQQDAPGPPWLFVGVGNPGDKFQGTRHNIGFEMIDAVSRAEEIALSSFCHNAILGEGTVRGVPVLIAKPQTYANLIGESVVPLSEQYGVPAERIVVMFDDMDTRLATLQLLPKGGHYNHKGLLNLIKHLEGNRYFPRLRIGIGAPPGGMDPRAFVLQAFCKKEREMMDFSILHGVEVIRLVAEMGIEKAIKGMPELKRSLQKKTMKTS